MAVGMWEGRVLCELSTFPQPVFVMSSPNLTAPTRPAPRRTPPRACDGQRLVRPFLIVEGEVPAQLHARVGDRGVVLQIHFFAGISVLAARSRTLIHQRRLRTARFLHPTLFRSQLPSAGAALDGKPTGAPAFRVFLRQRSTRVPCLRRCVALRPRVSLLAPAAPRSSAACRRTVAWSDVLPPAGTSSTAHASPAGPQFSPAAAGDS